MWFDHRFWGSPFPFPHCGDLPFSSWSFSADAGSFSRQSWDRLERTLDEEEEEEDEEDDDDDDDDDDEEEEEEDFEPSISFLSMDGGIWGG